MRRAFALRAPNAQPEAMLQRAMVEHLRAYLPDEVWWTASLSGVKLTPAAANLAKAAGMERGAPDLSFVWPDGSTSYVEAKAGKNGLTPEQARLAQVLGDDFAVARSLEELVAILSPRLDLHGLRWLTPRESIQRLHLRRARAA